MVLQQQHELVVKRGQHNQGNAHHRKGNHRHLRAGKPHECHTHAKDASAKHTKHISGKTDAKGLRRVIGVI